MPAPIEQLLSRTVYSTDGATAVWNFAFSGGYLDTSHVKAKVTDPLGVVTEIPVTPDMLIGPNQIQIIPPLAGGNTLTLYRKTPRDLPMVDFAEAASLNEVALDTTAKQAVFLAAELEDASGADVLSGVVEAASEAALSANVAAVSSAAAAASASAAADSATAAAAAADSLSGTTSTQRFSGDGTTTVFTLALPAGTLNLRVYIGGLYQQTNTWSRSGTNLVFTQAPPAGTLNIEVDIFASIAAPPFNPLDYAPAAHVGSGGAEHSAATQTTAGFMSATDKEKLDSVVAVSGLVKVAAGVPSAAVPGTDYLAPTGDISGATGLTSTQVVAALGFTPSAATGRLVVSVVGTNTLAVAGGAYVLTANMTLTLPATPAKDDVVAFSNRSGATTCTIARNGSNLMGLAEDMTLDAAYAYGTLVYTDATRGWVFI